VSAQGGTRIRPTRRPLIVLAGEDSNDRQTLRILLEAFCADAQGRIVEIKDSVRLCRANDTALHERINKLAGSIRARAVREQASVKCIFVHEDFDAVESERRSHVRRRVQSALDRQLSGAHYVLATWEVEAWMLLFPQALTEFAASWKLPQRYVGVDTGRISDPKRVMRDEVSKSGPKYRESDAPAIFKKIVDLRSQPARRTGWIEPFL
jgi:hypothetical protein